MSALRPTAVLGCQVIVIGVFTAAVLGTAIPLGCAPPRAIETSQLLASTSSASELPERLLSSGNVARQAMPRSRLKDRRR